jgi:two-component system, cell cycle sensor histidine kinase and response regulator CckA
LDPHRGDNLSTDAESGCDGNHTLSDESSVGKRSYKDGACLAHRLLLTYESPAPLRSPTDRSGPGSAPFGSECVLNKHHRLYPYALALAATLLMVAARALLMPVLGFELPFITLFPALFFAAWVGGFGPSLLAAVLGAACAIVLFFPPSYSLATTGPVAQLGVALFVLIGLIAGALGESRLRVLGRAREAAETARRSQDRYQTLIQQTAEGMWRIELPVPIPIDLPPNEQIDRFYALGELAECNDAMAQMYGFSRAGELTGARLADLVPRTDPRNLQFLEAFVRSGYRLMDAESHELGRDGQSRFFLNNLIGIVSEGRLVRAWGSQRDITGLKKAEEAVLASEARFRGVFESGMIGIAFWNRQVVTGANDTFLALLGYDRADLEQGLLRRDRLWSKGDEDADIVARQEVEKSGVCTPYEKEFLRKDGSKVPVLVGAARLTGDNDLAFFVLDLTDRRRVEERMRQVERMEVVGQLAGGMAHEANNQMSVVLGATEFILRRADVPPEVRQDAEYIRAAAERTAAITRQLLAFSRRQILQPQAVHLNEVVKKLEPILRRTLMEHQRLELRLGSNVTAVRADPIQLDQVLLNLAINARDAMPQGGVLTIQTTSVQLSAEYGARRLGTAIRPGPFSVLLVSDTGTGMDRETIKHVFEPFFTTKGVGKGSGLGLAMVYGIVKQSGGYIWPYSEPGLGTTFKIYLPSTEDTPAIPAEPQPEKIRTSNSATVLVVEDDPLVRAIARRTLTEAGFSVMDAEDGHEALSIVARDQRIDVVLTDVAMPDLGGRELARRLSPLLPGVPVIFMSGYTDDDLTRRGLLEAGIPFLEKPFSPQALARVVQDVLDGTPSHPTATS